MAHKISTCIICKNEAARITTCLNSVRWCEDIVLVDSGSTDGTLELAAAHPAKPRVITHPWEGYNRQREFAVRQCANDWVLALDADEECSPELAAEIQALPTTRVEKAAMFRMPRHNFLSGRMVRCWSPDYQTRLVHRARIIWDTRTIPEQRHPAAGFTTLTLTSPLLHNRCAAYSDRDLNDGAIMAERASLLAEHLEAQGRRAGWSNLLLRPALTFFKYFIWRGGFLQGRLGLVIAYKTTIGVMLKYSVLFGRQELAGKTTPDDKAESPAPSPPNDSSAS